MNSKQTFPNMRQAVMAWAEDTKVFIVGKSQQDFKTIESYYEQTVKMVRIPSAQNLEMKMEGERRWNYETIYADHSLDLKVDDIIVFGCTSSNKFRVVNKIDYTKFGYIQYEVVSDYSKGFK
jgi:hypothetical protein